MWRRYVVFLAIVIAGYGLAYAKFGPLVHELVQFSRLSTAVFGLITYLVLVAPMCLFVSMALNAIRETTRSSALAHVGPFVSLPVAGLLGFMITPGALGLWVSGPLGQLITGAVVASVTAGLRLGTRPTLPLLVRVATGTVGFGLIGLVALVSSLFWLALPFSLAAIPAVAILAPCSVLVVLAWWLLLGTPASDIAETNRRLVNAIGACVLAGLATDGAMYAVLASRTVTVTRQMQLKPGGSGAGCSRVLLLDERCTALTREMCSDEVARYLASRDSVTVPVTYSITDDFGKVWSYRIRSIGTVSVDFKSDESVKKLNDVACMFLP